MSDKTDLLVIFPNNRIRAFGSLDAEVSAITPPVQCGLLAAYLRDRGFVVELLDADTCGISPGQVGEKVAARPPRLVLISTDQVNSGDVTKMAAAGETARAIHDKAPAVPVMFEGVVPSAYPERVLREEGADIVCQGEAYEPVAELLRCLPDDARRNGILPGVPGIWALRKDGQVMAGGHAPMFANVEALPVTAWDLMPPRDYRAHHWHCFDRLKDRSPYAALYTNFGCPYHCSYCSVNVVAGHSNFRARSVESVLREIDLLVRQHGVRNLRVLDNVFTFKPDLVEELCDRIVGAEYDLNIWAYARVETIRNPSLLLKMKRAGVNWLAYGFEAADDKVRAAVGKNTGMASIEQVIGWTQAAGINIVGNFIFGLPEDNLETMEKSFAMAKYFNFEWANFYCAMAYPGTPLYNTLIRDGVVLPREWSAYSQYSPNSQPLATKHLSSSEVRAFRDAAFKEYYSSPRYLDMIDKKFGPEAVAFVRRILARDIRRDNG